MRKFSFLALACVPVLVSCKEPKQSVSPSLPGIFIESLIQHKIELLEPYFPTVEFHKSLERNGIDQSDSVALKFVEASNLKLKENWTRISERIQNDNIDLSRIKIMESVSAQPFWSKKISRMVVVYSYGNKNWDDMEFIVGEFNNKILLLEIPYPEKVFSMKDSLKASKDARFEMEIRTPAFKKTLQDKVDKIISYVKENKIKEFGECISYPDDSASNDESRKQIATGFREKINDNMKDCGQPVYGDINSLDLPDGKWIVIQLKCNSKFVHFAFIRKNDTLFLTDIDAAGLK